MPPGAWLAKPSNVAETKITASVTKPICGSSGISMYIASAQKPRSTIPMPICSKVSGPPGSVTCQPSRPTTRGRTHTHADIDRQHHEREDGERAIEPRRQLVDGARGLRHIGDAETEHRGIAEPERQAGDEAKLGDLDGVEPPGRIDAVAHRTAGEHAGADVVADRIAGEAAERRDPVGDLRMADRAQGEQVVEGEREVAAGNAQRRR